ncbi:MAG: EAL domain-containing protein [Legionella sp.]|nr:MAG: EAL domain-containing protein [Legionella sp.]
MNEVKIDLSLVRDMVTKTQHERIVSSIITLAHALDMEVISEGVENQETRDKLRILGCDLIQGYLISPPLALADFIPYVIEYNNKVNDQV